MKTRISIIASAGLLCISLVAMEDKQKNLTTSTSIFDSAILIPAVVPAQEGSPLLPSTLQQLSDNGTIQGLATPVIINNDATAAIVYGGYCIHRILQNPPLDALRMIAEPPAFVHEFNSSRQEYLAAIVSIMWYLYSEAINKQQAFIDGSFIILDPDLKLYNFLMYYARTYNKTLTGTNRDPLSHKSDNPFAYSRDSSHWKETQSLWSHYGIDIRFQEDQTSQPLLPTGKSHILFGIVALEPVPRLFIKFEDNGIYGGSNLSNTLANGWELVRHGLNYIQSRVPKQEKKMAPWLYDKLLKPIFGSDEGPEARREHTTVTFVRGCDAILQHSPKNVYKKYHDLLDRYGVSKLGEFVETRPEGWDDHIYTEFTRYYKNFAPGLITRKFERAAKLFWVPMSFFHAYTFIALLKTSLRKQLFQVYSMKHLTSSECFAGNSAIYIKLSNQSTYKHSRSSRIL